MSPSAYPKTYRLRGKAGGEERVFDLAQGAHRLGSSSSSDIQLPSTGISRQHAVLLVNPGGLVVEDRGSTNGTFVNGTRVERAEVPGGAELRFGPVRFQVETLEDQDAEIAIELGSELPTELGRSGWSLRETTQIQSDDETTFPGVWLPTIEGFLARLSRPDRLNEALAFLGESLGLAGTCVVEWNEGEPALVLASWGVVHTVPSREEIREQLGGAKGRDREGRLVAGVYETEPALSLAVRFGPADLGLILWGEHEGRPSSPALLRILLGLLDRLWTPPVSGDATPPAQPRDGHPELAFPAGYEIGTSPAMTALYQEMKKLLRGDLPVLIEGETGVGKELVARVLHRSSKRRGPWVAVNCAAIPKELLEAEMFGIAKAVATGVGERPGKFQEADGGTLFLDEISEMSSALQAKLLRALQEKEIHPVGGRTRPIDVRILSATNADLMDRIESGRFRRDLYYRLAGYTLKVPPLRERSTDIAALVRHFLRTFSEETGIHPRGITVRALHLLMRSPWPGNVRQLENEIRRLVYRSTAGQTIDSSLLSPDLLSLTTPEIGVEAATSAALALAPRVRQLEIELIREALRRTDGHQTRAALLLGLSRNGLVKKMSRLGIRRKDADVH